MTDRKKFIIRLLIHILGAILIGLGVQTVVYSSIGAAPLDALTYYLSRISLQLFANSDFSHIKTMLGILSLLVGTIVTIILWFIRKDKKLIFTWLNIALAALTIFTWGILFDSLLPLKDIFYQKLLVGLSGIIVLSIGVFLTIISGLPAGPHEELLKIYDEKIKNVFISKLIVEVTYLILAFIAMVISLVVIDKGSVKFDQVGWFTILTIVSVSILLHVYNVVYLKIKNINKIRKDDQNESQSLY